MSYTINTLYSFGQPRVTFSGLISGINTGSIVNAETAAASQNQTLLLNSAATETTKGTLYANIAGQLDALDSAIASLQDPSLLPPSSGTTSDASRIAITTSATAPAGTYAVNVTQLAQGQINNSANFASATSKVASSFSGSVTLAVGSGAAKTFNLTGTTTLTGLANAINSSGLAVAATIVNDSNGYHINLAGTGTGTSNALTITEVNSKTAFNSGLVQAAQDAKGTVNGTAFDVQSNTTSALTPGVTMTFAALTPSPVTIQVTQDTSLLNSGLQAFVAQYNAVASSINAGTAISALGSLDNLAGDGGVQNLTGELAQAVTSAPASASGTYHTLAEIGISLNSDGTLAIDSAALSTAISTDASSVASLLANTSSGTGIAAAVDAIATTYGGPTGILTQMSQAQAAMGAQETEAASDMQYAIDAQTATLQNSFVQMEVTMANLAAQNQIVEAYASSVNAANSGQDAVPTAASSSDSATAPTAASTDAASALDAFTAEPGSTTDLASNGVIPTA